jgi:hypothetical protein
LAFLVGLDPGFSPSETDSALRLPELMERFGGMVLRAYGVR